MSSPKGKRDIVRLRTFADDLEQAKKKNGVSDEAVAAVLPKEKPAESKGVFHKVKKKSLDLKATPDESNQTDPLNDDGVSFDEEVTKQVNDQAYEEQKAIKDASTEQTPEVVITPHGNEITSETPIQAEEKTPTPETKKTSPITLKTAETVDTIDTPATSIMDKSEVVHEVSDQDMSGGEIVSDKKRERFKLIPAIGKSMSDWFLETKEQIEEAKREKYTVSNIKDRAETIKAAAREKTIAPEEDFAEVAKRLKETEKIKPGTSPIVVKPKQLKKIGWTHTLSEDPASKTNLESTAKQMASVNINESPRVVDQSAVKTAKTEIATLKTAEQPTSKLAEPDLPAKAIGFEAPLSTPPAPTGVAEVVPKTAVRTTLPLRAVAKRELLPSPVLALIVVVLAIISGVGTSLYFFWQPEPEVTVPVATTQPLFTAELQTNIEFSENHSETMGTLLSAVKSNPGSLYMYLTRNAGLELVRPTEIMSFLAPQVPGSFARSVTNVSFGAFDNQPFIVLRVNNFDNAFSGMLSWEQTMSVDLSPLFGPVVTESYDPQARTDSQTRAAFFKDIIASNLSSRLLTDEKEADRILYTFIDKQTIIITTDRLQLANILPLIR